MNNVTHKYDFNRSLSTDIFSEKGMFHALPLITLHNLILLENERFSTSQVVGYGHDIGS